jgi:hypothetical protein
MKINIDIPDGKSGKWEIDTFTITENEFKKSTMQFKEKSKDFSIFEDRGPIPAGKYKRLMYSKITMMSNTPNEIEDHIEFINNAKEIGGHILINGLGLAVAVTEILKSSKVKKITIIDLSQDVIKLVRPHIKDKRVEILNDDAFIYKIPKGVNYSCVWHDIWFDIASDNLPDMEKLHEKYKNNCDWQGAWCELECREMKITEENEQ